MLARALTLLAFLSISSCATAPRAGLAPFCTPQSSFGVAFGRDPEFDGEIMRYDSLAGLTYAPFTDVEIARGRLTGVAHTVSGYRLFYTPGHAEESAAEGERLFNEVRARIEASGAFVAEQEREDSVRYWSVNTAPNARVRMWLIRSSVKVSLTCQHDASFQYAWDEMPEDVRQRAEEALRRLREAGPDGRE
jgi:hypothetical protein